ncbi:hypothetical protein GCM10023213_19640 [Prosthecobacter algae]|uniref:Uncharacterized protein n=2 Tax=Prosthecobacter algae TaxID=1144682 RepID=A0ABP9P305_9BACT
MDEVRAAADQLDKSLHETMREALRIGLADLKRINYDISGAVLDAISKPVPLAVNQGEGTPIVKAAHLFGHTTPASSSKAAEQHATGTDGEAKSKKVTYRSGRKK